MNLKEAIEILETRQAWLLRKMRQDGSATPSYTRAEEGALRTVLHRIKQLPALDAVAKMIPAWKQLGREDEAVELGLTLKKYGVVLPGKNGKV